MRSRTKEDRQEIESLLRRGNPLTIVQIVERTGFSRGIVYQEIQRLLAAGVTVKREKQSWGAYAYWVEKVKAS